VRSVIGEKLDQENAQSISLNRNETTLFRVLALTIFLILALPGCDSSKDRPLEHEFVVMETTAGMIEIELYPEAAPESVSNLLRCVDAGAFGDGRIWRVVNPANDNNPSVIGARNPDGQGFAVFGKVIVGMAILRRINVEETIDHSNGGYFRGQQFKTPIVFMHVQRR